MIAAVKAPGRPTLWRPLSTPIFRRLLLADVVSDLGSFMQSVGAAWLMVALHAGPMYVALTQTASTLPFLLLALPAGAIGDIVDRRRLILVTEIWMVVVAVILAVVTYRGAVNPWMVLALTFALSAGDAVETPSWRAILPEVVKKEDLAAAAALNGIEFNVARAIGPALAGLLIAASSVSVAFAVNAVSFLGVLFVVARWKRPVHRRTTPPEHLPGATVAALRYVRYATGFRSLVGRSGVVMFFASAIFALLPTVAQTVGRTALPYGILLGCFGLGAILGALAIPRARTRWSTEAIASSGVVLLGGATVATGFIRGLGGLVALMLLGGAGWIVFISLTSALAQSLAPDWVRARSLAVFLLISQGGMAAGSAVWGSVASRAGLGMAFLCAGLGAMATATLGLVAKLPEAAPDVSPWVHWKVPVILKEAEPGLDQGPVLVTVEYTVDPAHLDDFLRSMRSYGRVRRRDGATRWELFRDVERADVYVETFLVSSWAEHLRQHERSTQADLLVVRLVDASVRGEPTVRHLVHMDARG